MTEHLFKLKKDSKMVGYLKLASGWTQFQSLGRIAWYYPCDFKWTSAHQFVTKDKNGKDVFAGDEVLVYRGRENIGEGYVFFNDRFLWWTVNNSSQGNDRGYPQDWSQLTLCDVDVEIIEEKEDDTNKT